MPTHDEPRVGAWYETEEGQVFQILAIDKRAGTTEIQDIDGGVEELDLEAWYDLQLKEVESPEDWRASMDEGSEAKP